MHKKCQSLKSVADEHYTEEMMGGGGGRGTERQRQTASQRERERERERESSRRDSDLYCCVRLKSFICLTLALTSVDIQTRAIKS